MKQDKFGYNNYIELNRQMKKGFVFLVCIWVLLVLFQLLWL